MKITFCKDSVQRYEYTHGRAPRGEGAWAFEAVYSDGDGSYTTEVYFTPCLSFAKAKKYAADHFRSVAPGAARYCEVHVMP